MTDLLNRTRLRSRRCRSRPLARNRSRLIPRMRRLVACRVRTSDQRDHTDGDDLIGTPRNACGATQLRRCGRLLAAGRSHATPSLAFARRAQLAASSARVNEWGARAEPTFHKFSVRAADSMRIRTDLRSKISPYCRRPDRAYAHSCQGRATCPYPRRYQDALHGGSLLSFILSTFPADPYSRLQSTQDDQLAIANHRRHRGARRCRAAPSNLARQIT